MSYGYRGIYNDTTSIATIYDHSLDLLNVLDDERKTTYEEERPIIFVGHSLGGIVIKQVSHDTHLATLNERRADRMQK